MSREYYTVKGDTSGRGPHSNLQAAIEAAGVRASALFTERVQGNWKYSSEDIAACTVQVLRDDGTVAATVRP